MHVSVAIDPGGPFYDGAGTYELSLDNGYFNLRHFYERTGGRDFLTRASIRFNAFDYSPPDPSFWRFTFDVPVGSDLAVGTYTDAQGGDDFFTYDLEGPFNNFDLDINFDDPCFRTIATFTISTLEFNASGTAIVRLGGTAAMHCCPDSGYCPYSPTQPALVLDFYYSECQNLDLNRDSWIGVQDLSIFLSNYGARVPFPFDRRTDFNQDGQVDLQDLSRLLNHYGEACKD